MKTNNKKLISVLLLLIVGIFSFCKQEKQNQERQKTMAKSIEINQSKHINRKLSGSSLNKLETLNPLSRHLKLSKTQNKEDYFENLQELDPEFLNKFTLKSLPFSLETDKQFLSLIPYHKPDEFYNTFQAFNPFDKAYFIQQTKHVLMHEILPVSPWEIYPLYRYPVSSKNFYLFLTLHTGKYGNSPSSPSGANFDLYTFDRQGNFISSILFASIEVSPKYNEAIQMADGFSFDKLSTGRLDKNLRIICTDNIGKENETVIYYQIESGGKIVPSGSK